MTIWLPNIDGQTGPRFQAIADAIEAAIESGTLADGTKLPPQRDLAYDLGVSLNTVTRSYAEAERRGLVRGEVGRGTYVRRHDAAVLDTVPGKHLVRPDTGPIDLRLNLPTVGQSADMMTRTLRQLSDQADSGAGALDLARVLEFQPDGSIDTHASAGAAWIGRLGLDVRGSNVFLTCGGQHAVLVALMAASRPGDTVLVEPMTYAPLKQMAARLALKLYPVAMDEDGLDPDALDAACRDSRARTLYCLPTLHTPTTITMPEPRRRAVAAIARRHDLTVIEDDVFGFLPPDRPPPLATFLPDQCIFITSVSKSLAPGLRIGYVHAPSRLQQAVRGAISMSCWMPPPLMAEITSRWINDGTADRLNTRQRTEIAARQRIAAGIFARHGYAADPYGLNIWLPLPGHWRADAFRLAAERRGVRLLTGDTFAVGQTAVPHAIRLCLGYETTRARLTEGLEIIAGLLDGSDESAPTPA